MNQKPESYEPCPKFDRNFTDRQIASFWSKVDKLSEDGCWIWTRAKDQNGYGKWIHNIKVHRFSFYLHNGFIPKFKYKGKSLIMHTCDNPSCVNPKHLLLGTNAENSLDAKNKNRLPQKGNTGPERHPGCMPKGDKHWSKVYPERWAEMQKKRAHNFQLWINDRENNYAFEYKGSKISLLQGVDIRRHYKNSNLSHEKIAKIYGVSRNCIRNVIHGKRGWRRLDKFMIANNIQL
jgi:hypothetical protein